jgi:hypothetical protein
MIVHRASYLVPGIQAGVGAVVMGFRSVGLIGKNTAKLPVGCFSVSLWLRAAEFPLPVF